MFNGIYKGVNLREAAMQWPVKPAFFYHHVANQKEVFHTHLYNAIGTKQFEKEIDTLLALFGNNLHLSFDDGLVSCYNTVKPILKQKGVQATFFINPDFINNKALFYRYKASILYNHLNQNKTQLDHLNTVYKTNLLKWVYQVKFSDAWQLNQLAEKLEISWDAYLKNHKPYLTTDQVNSLIQDGHLIGAHSMNHAPFYELTQEQQLQQMADSVQWVKQQFNVNYGLFSFPFTDWKVSKKVILHLHKHLNVQQSFGCAGLKHDSIINHYQRIALDDYALPIELRLKKHFAQYQLKKLIGKHVCQHL